MAFLSLSAQKFLAGEKMSEAFFDTNPPLSILIYIPAVLLAKLSTLPLYHVLNIYYFSAIALSSCAVYLLLKKTPNFTPPMIFAVLALYIAMNIIFPIYDFGQREHLLVLGLLPLVLLQALITQKIRVNTVLQVAVLTLSSIVILLKPHFGIVPAAIFIHRAITQKRITIFKDIDFLFLSFMALLYGLIIYIFFNDFLTIILPAVLNYYAGDTNDVVYDVTALLIIQASVPYLIYRFFTRDGHSLIAVFSVIAMLCAIPVLLQFKGWAYHTIPSYFFFFLSCSLVAYSLIEETINSAVKSKEMNGVFIYLIIISLLCYQAQTSTPPSPPTHAEYKNSKLAKIVSDCGDDCSFYLYNNMIDMPHKISIYTDKTHASRFPYFWFLPPLMQMGDVPETQKKAEEGKAYYASLITEDFKTHKPDILIIGNMHLINYDTVKFDFVDFMMAYDEDFKFVWDDYIFEQSLDIDRANYMVEKRPDETTIQYDVYRKRNSLTPKGIEK